MPKIVDHELQRQKFIEAAMRLIAREGLEGVTMRAVATEAGLSYGSLFHYFSSKDDLLMHAVRLSTSAQTSRVNAYSTRYSGLKALEHLLCDDVIINDSSRDAWMVWMTFLYKAAVHKPFAEMNAELIDGWLSRIAGLLEEARDLGEVAANIDLQREALATWAFSAGIGQIGLLQPNILPPKEQKRLVLDYLDKLRAGP